MYYNGETVRQNKRGKIEKHVHIKPSSKVSFPTIYLITLGCLCSFKTQASTEADKSLTLNHLIITMEKKKGDKIKNNNNNTPPKTERNEYS